MGKVCDWVEMTVKLAILTVGAVAGAVMLIFLPFPSKSRSGG